MSRTGLRLSRPVYEGLPWAYVTCGLGALAASYWLNSRAASLVTGLGGIAGVLGGVVVMLRRRDFRDFRTRYGNPPLGDGSPPPPTSPDLPPGL